LTQMVPNFLQQHGHKTIAEITAHWQEVEVSATSDAWLNFPPADYLDFVRHYPPTPFDMMEDTKTQLKSTSFLVRQAHRFWQTSSMTFQQLQATGAKRFVELGSFPFFIPLLLREYFGFTGEIAVSTNLSLTPEEHEFLARREIRTYELDLDPYVSDPKARNKGERGSRYLHDLPTELPLPSGGTDLVLMSHVIEHLYHPRAVVRECYRLLRSGGKLLVTTDNAMMIDVFANYVGGYGYIFEPVQTTAAMSFDFWRGHVRFFTAQDLATLVAAEGLTVTKTEYFQCIYDVFFEEYFAKASPSLCEWKRALMAETPWLRNDVAVVADKSP
jgi:SAM-dependent methyltransferase